MIITAAYLVGVAFGSLGDAKSIPIVAILTFGMDCILVWLASGRGDFR